MVFFPKRTPLRFLLLALSEWSFWAEGDTFSADPFTETVPHPLLVLVAFRGIKPAGSILILTDRFRRTILDTYPAVAAAVFVKGLVGFQWGIGEDTHQSNTATGQRSDKKIVLPPITDTSGNGRQTIDRKSVV